MQEEAMTGQDIREFSRQSVFSPRFEQEMVDAACEVLHLMIQTMTERSVRHGRDVASIE